MAPRPIPLEDRLWPYVIELDNGCWLWTRSTDQDGYGQLWDRAVRHLENVRRGLSGALVTHCPQGHAYTPQNTYIYRRCRYCRVCRDGYSRRAKAKRRVRA